MTAPVDTDVMRETLAEALRIAVHPDGGLPAYDDWPDDLRRMWLRAADVALGLLQPNAPAPYTEPREDDEVEVRILGIVKEHGLCVGARIVLTMPELNMHAMKRRVRLVKAAAPRYEAGRIYRSRAEGGRFVYSPTGRGDNRPWFNLDDINGSNAWLTDSCMPSDLVPCDVVPRGEA